MTCAPLNISLIIIIIGTTTATCIQHVPINIMIIQSILFQERAILYY